MKLKVELTCIFKLLTSDLSTLVKVSEGVYLAKLLVST